MNARVTRMRAGWENKTRLTSLDVPDVLDLIDAYEDLLAVCEAVACRLEEADADIYDVDLRAAILRGRGAP